MTELEKMAAQAFEKFGKETGQSVSWAYISEERKQAWMCEIIFYVDHVTSKLNEKFKPTAPSQAMGAYAAGYNDGITIERMAIQRLIESIGEEYKRQFNERLEINKEKERQNKLG